MKLIRVHFLFMQHKLKMFPGWWEEQKKINKKKKQPSSNACSAVIL